MVEAERRELPGRFRCARDRRLNPSGRRRAPETAWQARAHVARLCAMKITLLRNPAGLALLLAFASCAAPAREVARHDAATFYGTTSLRGASFSSDGKRLLVTSDASGVFNAYALDLARAATTPGFGAEQLTFSTGNAITTIEYFPADDRFLYASDQGGNELDHIFVHVPEGEPHDLTPGQDLKADFVRWGSDARSFFVRTNERDPRAFDLYVYRFGEASDRTEIAPGFSRELLYQNRGGHEVEDVSRDGKLVALRKSHDNADSDVYLVRTDQPETEPVRVTPHEGKVANGVATFSPDGRVLYLTSNEGSEFDRVWAYDLAAGTRKLAFQDDWDVTLYRFSEDGRRLVVGVNAEARTKLRVFDVASGREIELPKVPAGDVTSVAFARGGDRMAFYVNGDTNPADVHLLDLESGERARITDSMTPAIRRDELVEALDVRYPSFDGLQIPALLYRPHQASAGHRVPALVWVHGGPGGQCRKGYNPTLQHLVNHGYAVLAVNNRGSSGYGKTFFHLDDRAHGNVDLKDCVYARRYLESLDWVRGDRVGIIGGSYGGYLVCAALAFEPDAFDVGIDIFGVTNWLRTLASIPPWWSEIRESLYSEIGNPVADKARLEARSPLLHAGRIEKPLLVIQGKNDPRVLAAESREIADAVTRKGIPLEFIEFDDEGHGFRKKANRIRASDAFVAFLDRHLAPEPAPTP